MKRALCIVFVAVAIAICFASPIFANGEPEEPPWGEPQQNRYQWQLEYQNGELEGQIEMSQIRLSDWP